MTGAPPLPRQTPCWWDAAARNLTGDPLPAAALMGSGRPGFLPSCLALNRLRDRPDDGWIAA